MSDQDEPLTDVEEYALDIVAGYAESGVEDDIDEDGVLFDEEEHQKACDLAMAIIRGMKNNPDVLLEWAHAEMGDDE